MEQEQSVLAEMVPDGAAQGSTAGHPLSSLILNARTYCALCRHGISTVEQLAQLHEADLWQMRQVGVKMVAEIQAALVAWGTPMSMGPLPTEDMSVVSLPPGDTALHQIPCLWEEWSLPAWLAEDHTPLDALALGPRTYGALQRSGLLTVRQTVLLKVHELLGIRNIGSKAIEDIRLRLSEYGSVPGRRPSPLPPDPKPVLVQPVEKRYSFAEVISVWLEGIAPRDRLIVTRRFGLDGKPRETLEEIGQAQGITRERVRQIVSRACQHLVQLEKEKCRILSSHYQALRRFLADKDGLASAEEILRDLSLYLDLSDFDPLLSCQILTEAYDELRWFPSLELMCDGSASQNQVLLARRELRKLPPEEGNTLALSQLPLACAASRSFQERCGQMDEGFLLACLRTDPDITIANGVITWPERTKNSAQRLIVALREIGAPAHYSDITIKVNEGLPENEQVTERNVNALLQRCTDLFVRVDSGTYGLIEWSLHDDSLGGSICDLLAAHGQPLAVDEIIAQLGTSQRVTGTAVRTALTTDPRFQHVGRETYGLATWTIIAPETLAEVAARVLAEAGQPLSLKELTDRVLAIRPGARSTMAATMAKDIRFTRVGPGTYALTEWAGEDRPTVVDAARRVLEEAGVPLKLDQIARSLPMLQPVMISVALAQDARFRQSGQGDYSLAEWHESACNTAAEAVLQVLSTAGRPLSLGEIEKSISALHPVAHSTLCMLLANDPRFCRIRIGVYDLADWHLPTQGKNEESSLENLLAEALRAAGTPLSVGDILRRATPICATSYPAVYREIVHSSRFVCLGGGVYGLTEWGLATEPQDAVTIADTVYQVLQQAAKPLSPREILECVRVVRPAASGTVSGLLYNDPRFQRYGTSLYGLAEWALVPQAKPSATVTDTVYEVLRQAGGPLALREILRRVTAVRPATLNTLCSRLGKDERFVRVSQGVYALRDSLDYASLWQGGESR